MFVFVKVRQLLKRFSLISKASPASLLLALYIWCQISRVFLNHLPVVCLTPFLTLKNLARMITETIGGFCRQSYGPLTLCRQNGFSCHFFENCFSLLIACLAPSGVPFDDHILSISSCVGFSHPFSWLQMSLFPVRSKSSSFELRQRPFFAGDDHTYAPFSRSWPVSHFIVFDLRLNSRFVLMVL